MNRLAIAVVVAGTLAPAIAWGQVGEVVDTSVAKQVVPASDLVRNFEAAGLPDAEGSQCPGIQVKAAHARWELEPEEAAARPRGKKGKDSCKFAKDGECDEPDLCDPGTDTSDCRDEDEYEDEDIDDDDGGEEDNRGSRPLYCCDGYGRKWCQIVTNPGPVGSPCWCAGVPGTGTMCR